MLFFTTISLTLLALACLSRGIGSKWPAASRGTVIAGTTLSFLLLGVQQGVLPGNVEIWFDPLTPSVTAVAVVTCLLVSLLDSSPVRQSAACWSGGLLVTACLTSNPLLIWSSLQFTAVALMFYGRGGESANLPIWRRHPTILLGSILFTIGFVLHLRADSDSILRTMSMVMILCGVGGMLGWFPFPRVARALSGDDPVLALIGQRFLPLLTAAVVLWKLGEISHYTRAEAFLLVLASLFSLALSSVRLLREDLFSRRLALNFLCLFSFLTITLFVQNWEWTHADRDWGESSNLPTGSAVFVACMVGESCALLLLVCGQAILIPHSQGKDVSATMAGAASQHGAASLPLVVGLFSVCGVPPFPGFWWRLGLIMICLLPHRQSNMTRVVEGDNAYSVVAMALLFCMIVQSLGNLKLVQRVLFEQGFRIRDKTRTWGEALAVMIVVILFLVVAWMPLSLETQLLRLPEPMTGLSFKTSQE